MKKKKLNGRTYAVCIKNTGYPASLELRKLYEIILDKSADEMDQVRVVDESGEDYLYPKEFFIVVQLPQSISKALQKIAS